MSVNAHNTILQQHSDEVFEGFHVRYAPAPILKRIIAYCTDLGVITAVLYFGFIVAFIPIMGIMGAGGFAVEGEGISKFSQILFFLAIGIGVLIFAGIYHGYFIYQEVKTGTTLGKRIFGLRVISENGERLTVNQCVIRDLMRYIDAALIFPGLIAMLASERRRRLGDMLCNTLVVYSQSQEAKATFLYMTQEDYHLWRDKLGVGSVPKEVCTDFLGLAYPIFITGAQGPTLAGEDKQFWLNCVHHYLPQAATSGLNTLELQQFFAEHCNQQLISVSNKF